MSPQRICAVIAATLVLHNIAREMGLPDFDDEEYFDDDNDDQGDIFNGPIAPNGQVVRRMVTHIL